MFLQLEVQEGGIALPNIFNYYQAALLENILQWEQPETEDCWV